MITATRRYWRLRRLRRQLTAVWAQVLDRERIGPTDNFLDLGGNSIAATRIINRAEELTGRTLSVRVLLETQTVDAMARRLVDSEGLPS